MAAKEKQELAAAATFEVAALDGDMIEAIKEEMDGLGRFQFPRVRIPSGGAITFELPGEDEDNPEVAKAITGIILYHHPANARWNGKFGDEGVRIVCSSIDGKAGRMADTGEVRTCSDCPYNQFREDGTGKECKNMHRLYLLMEGSPFPVILTLPPTSLKPFKNFVAMQCLGRGLRVHDVVTKVTLKKVQGPNSVYSIGVFSVSGRVTKEQKPQVESMRRFVIGIKDAYGVSSEDYDMKGEHRRQAEPEEMPDFDPTNFEPMEGEEELPFMDVPESEG